MQELIEKVGNLIRNRFGGDHEAMFRHYASDGQAGREDIIDMLRDADVGNRFTRGFWVNGIFDKVDTDKDNQISMKEFQDALRS